MSQPNAVVAATFSFTLSSSPTRYGPRIGTLISRRPESNSNSNPSGGADTIQIQTPGILTATSRGVVPHLSRDHQRATAAIRWVNVPFETFLEHNPPVPTLQSGPSPLHTFLGYIPGKHIVSMTARDPYDGKEMPPNGNNHISVYSLRGVRKLSPIDWKSHSLACKPDIIFALSDTPFTDPPYSQKRLTKSIERSAAWLSTMLRPSERSGSEMTQTHPNVFVHMSGGTSVSARKAFSSSLLEHLYGPEAVAIRPLQTLDEGVSGYTFDLIPLRQSLSATGRKASTSPVPSPSPVPFQSPYPSRDISPILPSHTEQIVPLLKASLASLPEHKPRLVNSTESPHEILHYISSVGVDLFDAQWAQRAADIGVALDFEFPVRSSESGSRSEIKRDIGHNLYEQKYSLDFSPFADAFRGASSSETNPICPCAACSPAAPPTRLFHGVDTPFFSGEIEATTILFTTPTYRASYTRAYIHHLLHTHEMSAHTLLTMHNLSVLDAFFAGIRDVIAASAGATPEKGSWEEEVARFTEKYDEGMGVFADAKVSWREVEMARGKGRLAREKVKGGTAAATAEVVEGEGACSLE